MQKSSNNASITIKTTCKLLSKNINTTITANHKPKTKQQTES